MIHFIIPTFARQKEIIECIGAIRANTPREILGQIVIVDSNDLRIKYPDNIKVVYINKVYPAIARNTGANFLRNVSDNDYFIFLDDDILILDNFRTGINKILRCYERYNVGCLQLGLRKGKHWVKIKLGFTGGGILINKKKYFEIGGYGKDYLDDVELFLRSYIYGYDNYRTGYVYSKHRFSSHGGVKASLNLERKGKEHLKLSRLDKTYPDFIERTDTWLGFKIKSKTK